MDDEFQLALPERIRTPSFTLRTATEADVDAFVAAARESAATVGRYMSWVHPQYTRDEALAWFAMCRASRMTGDAFEYLVVDARDQLLGAVGLNHVNTLHRLANLGYWVRASCERRGVASEAARTLARAGLEQAGLVRVEIIAEVTNRASQRVAVKAGAMREGVLRNRIFLRGEARDAVGYSLVATDFG